LGLGLISGAANDDPAAVGTSAQAGAAFGYSLLWTAPLTFPMMAATVFLSSKLGMVTGNGIAGVMRRHYPRWLLYPLVVTALVANILEAGADLGAIAAGLRLLVPVPVTGITVGITAVILIVQTWGSYELLHNILKWLTIALFAYVGAAFLAKPAWAEVLLATVRPTLHFNRDYLAMLVAIFGARLSPYLYFWQANQEVEEQMAMGPLQPWRAATEEELRYAGYDINIGMFFSNLITYFITLCTAATLFQMGERNVGSAYQAAQALRPLAGPSASLLFTLGIIGVGLLAVPVLTTGPAYALAETFGWKYGLHRKPEHAPEFYAVIALSTCVALAIAFSGINPIKALIWASMLMGLLAPPLMVMIMLMTNNRKIMGTRVNSLSLNILGWGTTAVITIAALALIWTWLF
jgi:NRAMP (natural resistance-associated macrophage protein)-like metal ion transporter